MVPVPFVHLALSELQALRDAPDELARPVWVLEKLVLELLQLVFVLALTTLDVATGDVLILSLLKERRDALVKVSIFEFEIRNVKWIIDRRGCGG